MQPDPLHQRHARLTRGARVLLHFFVADNLLFSRDFWSPHQVEAHGDKAIFVHVYGPEPHPAAPDRNFDSGKLLANYWSVRRQSVTYDDRLEQAKAIRSITHPDQVTRHFASRCESGCLPSGVVFQASIRLKCFLSLLDIGCLRPKTRKNSAVSLVCTSARGPNPAADR